MPTVTRARAATLVVASALALSLGLAASARVEAQAAKAENARVKALLRERADTLKGISDRMQQLSQANLVGPQDVFQARTAAAFAAADAAESDAARVAVLQNLLNDTLAYEKLVADSVRANPAKAGDTRGSVERVNALAHMKVSRIDLELAIERIKEGK